MIDAGRIGYALCAAHDDRDADEQRQALELRGCTSVYLDRGVSVRPDHARPELPRALHACHTGYTLIVTALDRLGPSLRHIHTTLAELHERGVHIEINGTLYRQTDGTALRLQKFVGDVVDSLFALLSRKTAEGRALAKAQPTPHSPRPVGRPSKLSRDEHKEVRLLVKNGVPPATVAKRYSVSPATVKRIVAAPESDYSD